jgi:predicted metal-dependent phosphoesterase TrpH
MVKKADLHIHTTFSDGTLSPEETVRIAHDRGLSTIAIADHDEIGGVEPGCKAGKDLGVDIIPAVEVSSKKDGRGVHILAYFVETTHPELVSFLQSMREARLERAKEIVLKLQECGIPIEFADVLKRSEIGVIGRPHIAEELIRIEAVKDLREAFSKFLGFGKPCYVSKVSPDTSEAIQLISRVGGVPVLAHPRSSGADKWIEEFVAEGLKGMEIWYPNHSEADVDHYLRMADKYNLIPTGGSDSHGTRDKFPKIGEFSVPLHRLERILECRKT